MQKRTVERNVYVTTRPTGDPVDGPTTREVLVEEETVVYDTGEPHYPGTYFAGGRGGGGGGGGGGPSNGIPGYGPYGRFRVEGPWLLGLSLDAAEYEFDDVGYRAGVIPADDPEAEIDTVTLTAWAEYEFQALAAGGFGGRFRPFVGAGVGFGFLGDDDLTGVTTGGGAYDLDVDGDIELVPGLVAGLRIDLVDPLVLEVGGRIDYHVTDLEVHDNVTGASAEFDDYATYGGYVGLQFRW